VSVFKEATRFPFFKNLKCGMKLGQKEKKKWNEML
jgi:hypothetical protein